MTLVASGVETQARRLLTTKMKLRWLPWTLLRLSDRSINPRRPRRSFSARGTRALATGRRKERKEECTIVVGAMYADFFRSRPPHVDVKETREETRVGSIIHCRIPRSKGRPTNDPRANGKTRNRVHTSCNIHSRPAGNDSGTEHPEFGFLGEISSRINMIDRRLQYRRLLLFKYFTTLWSV